MNDWTKLNIICDPVGDIREFGKAMEIGRPLTPFERPLIRAGLDPRVMDALAEFDPVDDE